MTTYRTEGGAELILGDCVEALRAMEPNTIDTIVTDPPYGLEFLGKEWDTIGRTVGPGGKRRKGENAIGKRGDGWQPGATYGAPKKNPRCLECMRLKFDHETRRCQCEAPSFHARGGEYGEAMEAWHYRWAAAAFRVLKPGALVFAFGGTRTYHRLACALEDAGFELRDCLAWLYGSGFPKSLDVAKAIDKKRDDLEGVYRVTAFVARARDAAGKTNREIDELFGLNGMAGHWTSSASQPAVPTWEQWQRLRDFLGFGPELDAEVARLNDRKGNPGEAFHDREVVGSGGNWGKVGAAANAPNAKEFDVTRAASDLARKWEGWGTALKPAWEPILLAMKPLAGTFADNAKAFGVAGLNVAGSRIGDEILPEMRAGEAKVGTFERTDMVTPERRGRWPANVVLDPEAAKQLDREAGGERPSRFFYTGKATSEDKGNRDGVDLPLFGEKVPPIENRHPTVKPTSLMEWLVELSRTPGDGGVVLDPFMGSGSTGVAARRMRRRFVGIERDPESHEIARRRIEWSD